MVGRALVDSMSGENDEMSPRSRVAAAAVLGAETEGSLKALVDSSPGAKTDTSGSENFLDLCIINPPRQAVFWSRVWSSSMLLTEDLVDLHEFEVRILETRMSGVRLGSVTGGRPIMLCMVSQPDSSVALDCSLEEGMSDSVD